MGVMDPNLKGLENIRWRVESVQKMGQMLTKRSLKISLEATLTLKGWKWSYKRLEMRWRMGCEMLGLCWSSMQEEMGQIVE